uniref:Uncharacterized protein n=1 Tax=Siphoviridae sp. ctMgg26 TaxID=2825462 RepID=A0A8S5PZ14_9CAUD|nr:MAG TPA: hypothetical protein [Siphoviridae sp. ctMgg26]
MTRIKNAFQIPRLKDFFLVRVKSPTPTRFI